MAPLNRPGSLSLVVPCYNEEQRIPLFAVEWEQFRSQRRSDLRNLYSKIEIIFVDDGSRDRTYHLLQEIKEKIQRVDINGSVECVIHRLPINQGKGAAVRTGILSSRGEWVLITDVDLSTPLHQLFRLQTHGVDIAMGSRALRDSKILRAQNGLRPFLGRGFNLFLRKVTGIPFYDTQCGFKLLRGPLAREIAKQMRENRFAFDIELLLLANKLQAKTAEVPVEWAHQEPSRVAPWSDGMKMAFKVMLFASRYPRWQVANKNELLEADSIPSSTFEEKISEIRAQEGRI